MIFEHKSVLLYETVDSLNIKPDGIYVDGTLGGGGHAFEVASRLGENGRLIGIDQDADAIKAATERLEPFKEKVTIVRSNYRNIREVLEGLGIQKVDGIYLDLGVSSYQLDTAERGFTYRENAPLDMRMDQRNDKTAADIVNDYTEMELFRVIRDYGEDKFAKNIAKHIVRARENGRIETTDQLVEIIKAAIPAKMRMEGGHPAKRTFQAIRIELNKELEVLTDSIDTMIDLLNPDGRLSIITFHSLEDRIVKLRFRDNENPCVCPPKKYDRKESDSMATGRDIKRTNAAYVVGNTARQLHVQEREYFHEERHAVTPRRGQERALPMELPFVIMLTIAAICTLYLCVSYLQLQSSITARLDHIEYLEERIETLKADNDALETRINTSVDLDYVYKVATEELGMVYANKNQVRLYNKTESEYVRQYEDIPER